MRGKSEPTPVRSSIAYNKLARVHGGLPPLAEQKEVYIATRPYSTQGIERPRATDKYQIDMIMCVKIIAKKNPNDGQRGNPGSINERRRGNKPRAPMNKLWRFAGIKSEIILNSSSRNVIKFQRYRRTEKGGNKEINVGIISMAHSGFFEPSRGIWVSAECETRNLPRNSCFFSAVKAAETRNLTFFTRTTIFSQKMTSK